MIKLTSNTRLHVFYILALLLASPIVKGQNLKLDSVTIIPLKEYDSVGKLHRKVFGENYRKDYAHPFGALVVPVLAQAAGIPHSNPVIGIVAQEAGLGIYAKDFANTLCLLEEREPIGKSDNTAKMLKQVAKSYRNRVDWADIPLYTILLNWCPCSAT